MEAIEPFDWELHIYRPPFEPTNEWAKRVNDGVQKLLDVRTEGGIDAFAEYLSVEFDAEDLTANVWLEVLETMEQMMGARLPITGLQSGHWNWDSGHGIPWPGYSHESFQQYLVLIDRLSVRYPEAAEARAARNLMDSAVTSPERASWRDDLAHDFKTLPPPEAEPQPQKSRSIPKAVQRAVWRRDQGRCVECGSQERLEFDHIIPFSKGGSNTERNVQLLCENCNRTKGASI